MARSKFLTRRWGRLRGVSWRLGLPSGEGRRIVPLPTGVVQAGTCSRARTGQMAWVEFIGASVGVDNVCATNAAGVNVLKLSL